MRLLRYDHVVGVVRNTRALEHAEILAATEQERKSAQESCQQYAEANLEGGVFAAQRIASCLNVLPPPPLTPA